ncbi:MAG: hypothetical protein BGO53_13240 [Sphingobacteriales bacterium 39-19]|nr:MAG: hypothetical protein BGO53_13240 [Sphingobacteriales bacterium 39-19]
MGVTVNLIDTPNANLKYRFIPGELISISDDSSFRFFYPDSVFADYTVVPPKIYTTNPENSKYNQFYNDLSLELYPIYQDQLTYFLGKKDSIIANDNFIYNYLSKNDNFIMQKINDLCTKYQFSEEITSQLLSSILETGKLALSYSYFSICIPKLDSMGILRSKLDQYINKLNQQRISVFSQLDITILIRSIAYQLTQKSMYRIMDKEEISEYFSLIQKLFTKGSISYDYLISSLEVKAKKMKIKLKGTNLNALRKDAKKSVFKKYVQPKYITYAGELNDLPHDKNLYDTHYHSADLSAVVSQFKNKPLLIDFWASWCLPCIKGIPGTINYKIHYPNLNILFISLDKHQDTWKLYLYGHDLMNYMQYRRNYNNQDSLLKQISEIPKYGLLDKNGQIEMFDEISDSLIKKYYERF